MSGEPMSTQQVWELLSDKLRGFLVRRVSDPQLAEDLLQETFLRIHQKVGDLDDQRRISAWVFQVARNLTIDHYRANAVHPETLSEQSAGPEADEENINPLVAGWLPEMIAQLPDTYRAAIELYELEGVSQQAIADRLGISLSGVKSRVQRGRAKLKSMLLDCCSFEQDRRGNIIAYKQNTDEGCGPCDAGCNS